MRLQELPIEILLSMIHHLESERDISAFMRTSTLFYNLFSDYLYEHNAKVWNSSALRWATRRQLPSVALRSLQNGGNTAHRDPDWRTPLWIATESGDEDMMRLLLEHGAYPDSEGPGRPWATQGKTPLMLAAHDGHERLVQLLLDHGADIELAGGEEFMTPLHNAVEGGKLGVVKLLLERGAAINGHEGMWLDSPLSRAIHRKEAEIAQYLINKGADVNHTNQREETPLLEAVNSNRMDLVALLVRSGASVVAADGSGPLALGSAIWENDLPCVQLLIESGLDVNYRGFGGDTALMVAVRAGSGDAARWVIEKGADVNLWCTIRSGYVSRRYEYRKLIELLRAQGADLKSEWSVDVTPLFVAAANGDEDMCRFLVEHGAKVDVQTVVEVTPRCLADTFGYIAIVRLMDAASN